MPAIPKCDNCPEILEMCARTGGKPRAVCRACAVGSCYEDGPDPVPPPGQPFPGHWGGWV